MIPKYFITCGFVNGTHSFTKCSTFMSNQSKVFGCLSGSSHRVCNVFSFFHILILISCDGKCRWVKGVSHWFSKTDIRWGPYPKLMILSKTCHSSCYLFIPQTSMAKPVSTRDSLAPVNWVITFFINAPICGTCAQG